MNIGIFAIMLGLMIGSYYFLNKNHDTSIICRGMANHIENFVSINGQLFLYEDFIEFKYGLFGEGASLCIDLVEIIQIEKFNLLGFIPTAIKITHQNGFDVFTVYKRTTWLEQINAQLKFIEKQNSIIENNSEIQVNSKQKDIDSNSYNKNISKKQIITTSSNIKITNCTVEDLTALNISLDRAEQIIAERESGKTWNNINALSNDIELQPHEIALLKDKLIFPTKTIINQGRKVDW